MLLVGIATANTRNLKDLLAYKSLYYYNTHTRTNLNTLLFRFTCTKYTNTDKLIFGVYIRLATKFLGD